MDLAGSASVVRTVSWLVKLVAAVVVVAVLARARDVLLPIAFATVLAFILTPAMKWVQRYLPRLPAMALVMLLAVGALGSAAYVIADQLNDLTTQLGKYTESMRNKVAALQTRSGGGPLARVEAMFARISEGLDRPTDLENAPIQMVPARLSAPERLWAGSG